MRLDSWYLQGVSLVDRIIADRLDDLEVSQKMLPMGFQIMLLNSAKIATYVRVPNVR